ncbi:50S ribosomal protein L13 [Candidatus Poribacteria bacterium]|nr:50S ribosomal protein L13 [Candidatus Poribacteria bacterium]
MKTFEAKEKEVARKWFIVNAEGKPLGRLASGIANVLRGKHKAIYTPHVDTGDFVVVINASKVKLTGKKELQKNYYQYSGYPGRVKVTPFEVMIEKNPEKVIHEAVRGMVPHNKLGRAMLKKLKVYAGNEHVHSAQLPEQLELVK